nr:anti-sigma regulatory factor [Lysinibacillus timonensis]
MYASSTVEIHTEWDIIKARQIARETAKLIGFDTVEQARIATAISEVAKNIFLYAQTGKIEIQTITKDGNVGIHITAIDHGPGILDVKGVLEEAANQSNGLGAGLPGVKRLMDSIEIYSEIGKGTEIHIEKWIHKR